MDETEAESAMSHGDHVMANLVAASKATLKADKELTGIAKFVDKKFSEPRWIHKQFAAEKIQQEIVKVVQGVVSKNSVAINEQIGKNIVKMIDDKFLDEELTKIVMQVVKDEVMRQFKDKYKKTLPEMVSKAIEDVEASGFMKDLDKL